MNIAEMRAKTKEELKEQLKKLEAELKELAVLAFQGKEKNHSKSKFMRRDIARVKTLINEKKVLEG